MSDDPTAFVCGGRMQLHFRTVAAIEDGEAVMHLVPHRALWDGQPITDVLAEALAITWHAAQEDEEDDLEDDTADD